MATRQDYISTDRFGAYRVGRHNQRNVYRVDPTSSEHTADTHVACAFDPEDGPRIVTALNDAERRRKVEDLRNQLARAHAEAGLPMPAVAVNACAVNEAQDDTTTADDDADWSGLDYDGHRVRAGELLDDARSFFLRSIAPGQSEETRADARTRCRLLSGLAYGHALLARSDR